ncbi:hypothetical protein Pint_08946 [Pistacia integerrima]|uniref:Uncharacterized protein n=1 Tax=Pistacia integerrima TaxID=434235 RepID=A0ACC0XWZ5_9ROSI|nr:hypothetical protein Pint_08946 [Pistacia integerrima]
MSYHVWRLRACLLVSACTLMVAFYMYLWRLFFAFDLICYIRSDKSSASVGFPLVMNWNCKGCLLEFWLSDVLIFFLVKVNNLPNWRLNER